jgi:dTDP-4-amino-4,6-dideoxygalactose transaminase
VSEPVVPTAGEIAMVDLQAQRRRLGGGIERAVARVLEHGQFIMGPEVAELERRLAAFSGVDQAVTCASGTDALLLALLAWGVGPGDAVYLPSFTFAATAEAAVLAGAVPVFVDVLPDTYNLDPDSLHAAVEATTTLRPRAVVAVDLFGQPADYPEIEKVAIDHRLRLLADAAQSYGGSLDGRRVGGLAEASATSFFPAKPLGCYGDGGALLTGDAELAAVVRSLRAHGKGADKYDHVRVGLNSRLDTLQAAILLEKLDILPEEIAARQRVTERYDAGLADLAQVPRVLPGARSACAQYTLVLARRSEIAQRLRAEGVPSAVHYPRPLHAQPAYAGFPRAPGGLPVSEQLAGGVLSLPLHPYLDEPTQDRVITALRGALRGGKR